MEAHQAIYLGIVKSIRKPFKKLIIEPFPDQTSREGSFFFKPSAPTCKGNCTRVLTCHQWGLPTMKMHQAENPRYPQLDVTVSIFINGDPSLLHRHTPHPLTQLWLIAPKIIDACFHPVGCIHNFLLGATHEPGDLSA